VDGDAAVADLAGGGGLVGVAAHERGHVEGDAEAAAPGPEEHLVSLVGLLGVTEAGELPDRPLPAAVAGRVEPAGVGVFAGPADAFHARVGDPFGRPVDRVHLHPRQRGEVGLALGCGCVSLRPALTALGDLLRVHVDTFPSWPALWTAPSVPFNTTRRLNARSGRLREAPPQRRRRSGEPRARPRRGPRVQT